MDEPKPDRIRAAIRSDLHHRWKEELRVREAKTAAIARKRIRLRYLRWVAAVILLLGVGIWWWLTVPVVNTDALFAENFTTPANVIAPDTRGSDQETELQSAMQFYEAGQYEQALVAFERLDATKVNTAVLFYRGISYLATGQLQDAAADLSSALEGDFRQSAQWYLSLCLLKQNKTDQSEEILHQITGQTDHPFHVEARRLYQDLQ